MDSKRWGQVQDLFEKAIELPADERVQFVKGHCRDDSALFDEVVSLLSHHDPEFLAEGRHNIQESSGSAIMRRFPEVQASRVGPYALLQRLGEGGMGEVWEAEQKHPVRRRVALKLIKWGMDSKAFVARFESERQALALMSHPNVARVLDAGSSETGRPYFVMELVKGVTITEHCDRSQLNTRERLQLFMQVCEGVQHAHQKGIIHRDIKPSNILVAREGDRMVPKIIDFGVAKATSRQLTEKTVFTELGQMIGTPEYMSPEQADLTSDDIDTRTDVYALGVLLYELLTGVRPFDPKELRDAGFDELRRIIREKEPSRPSTRLTSLGESNKELAQKRGTTPGTLVSQLRSDLDWITMKALEKDRARRYSSAADLAMDLHRHLVGDPVVARPTSVFYRLGKFYKRHRSAVLAGVTLLATVVAALVFSESLLFRAHTANVAATRSEYLANISAADLRLREGDTIAAKRVLDTCAPGLRGWEWEHLDYRADSRISGSDLLCSAPPERDRGGLPPSQDPADCSIAKFSADGTRVLTGRWDETGVWYELWPIPPTSQISRWRWQAGRSPSPVSVWDIASSKLLRELSGHHAAVTSIAMGKHEPLVFAGSMDGGIHHWNVESGVYLGAINSGASAVSQIVVSPDGTRLLAVDSNDDVHVIDALSAEPQMVLRGHTGSVTSVAVNAQGTLGASDSLDGTVRVWDLSTGRVIRIVEKTQTGSGVVGFSADGRQVFSYTAPRARFVCVTPDCEVDFKVSSGIVVADGQRDLFDPTDSYFLATEELRNTTTTIPIADRDRLMEWEIASGALLRDVSLLEGGQSSNAIVDSGFRYLAARGTQGRPGFLVFGLEPHGSHRPQLAGHWVGSSADLYGFLIDNSGSKVAANSFSGSMGLWLIGKPPFRSHEGPCPRQMGTSVGPTGEFAVTWCSSAQGPSLVAWSVKTGEEVLKTELPRKLARFVNREIFWSEDGTAFAWVLGRVATTDHDYQVHLAASVRVSLLSTGVTHEITSFEGTVGADTLRGPDEEQFFIGAAPALSLSRSSERLAMGLPGRLLLFEISTGNVLAHAEMEARVLKDSQFQGDDLVAFGTIDQGVVMWTPSTGMVENIELPGKAGAYSIFVPRDRGSLFVGTGGGEIIACEIDKNTCRSKLKAADTAITSIAATRDEQRLLWTTSGGQVGVWDLISESPVLRLGVDHQPVPNMQVQKLDSLGIDFNGAVFATGTWHRKSGGNAVHEWRINGK